MGSKLARAITDKAIARGQKPAQEKMAQPLSVKGVGKGSQKCAWKVICPIATPTSTGQSAAGRITIPIVEGTGADLPGLLGLRTIGQHRGILDTANRELILLDLGEAQII